MDYDYDLVSGKVNYFYYQKDKEDQLIHKYEYDGDNRIVKVFTSRDAITWDRDAKYDYYAHGPLAKTTIGEHEVETNTYAYTIQGWIKGVNGNSFSYALGYFDNGVYEDYASIGTNYTLSTPIAESGLAADKSLFNGNIATMASKTPQFASQGGADWVQQFEYDQLNRITASSTLAGANANTFKTGYEYDAGGNITKLKRWDMDGNQFDAMEYNYENTASSQNYKTNTNKLRWVDDTEPVAEHTSDIDDQQTDNYTYDDIGQLISDKGEEIANIEWTQYYRVKKVVRESGSTKPDLEFAYDVFGNRIFKSVKSKSGDIKNTYYILDVEGSILSIYETYNVNTPELKEQYVYGSSILGVLQNLNTTTLDHHVLGYKEYELTDHLSNVRVVIGDRFIGGINEVVCAVDNYPFGMTARSFSNGNKIRHQYNGQELDSEWGEETYDFGARFFDCRIARFLSRDKFAHHAFNTGLSPYHFALNSPLIAKDENGEFWNIVAGLIAGGVASIYVAATIDKDDPYYWRKVAAAGIGTAVGVATLGAGAPALIAALGGTAALGGAGTAMVWGAAGIGSGLIGGYTTKKALDWSGAGDEAEADGSNVVMSGVFGMLDPLVGGATKYLGEGLKRSTSAVIKESLKTTEKEYYHTVKNLAKEIKKTTGVTSKTAKKIASDIADNSAKADNSLANFYIRVTDGGISVGTNILNQAISEEIKKKANEPNMVVILMNLKKYEDKNIKRKQEREKKKNQ